MEKAYQEQFESAHIKRMENVDLVLATETQKRPHEADFVDESKSGFSQLDVKRDIETTEKMEERFKKDWDHLPENDIQRIKEGKKRSEALEVIIIDKGEEMNWFGERAHLSRTSRFDDIFNGIDGVLEFDIQESNPYGIALEIDASMKPDQETMKKKITRNTDKVLGKGKAIEVKYFQSKISGEKKKLTFVIPVVTGVEGDNANKLIELFADIERLKKPGKDEELQKKIDEAKNNPAQLIFLKEIKMQLEMYSKLLGKEGGMKQLYRKEVDKLVDIIKNIIDSKNNIDSKTLESDGVYNLVKKLCE